MNFLVFAAKNDLTSNLGVSKNKSNENKYLKPDLFQDTRIVCVVSSVNESIFLTESGELYLVYDFKKELLQTEEPIIKLVCGYGHYLCLSQSHKVYSWGRNSSGQSGHIKVLKRPEHLAIFDDKNIEEIFCGIHHSMCLDSKNNLYCFGHNSNGELGNGNKTNIYNPVICHENVTDVFLGFGWNSFIIKNDVLSACGHNSGGSLGIENFETDQTVFQPVKLDFNVSEIKQLVTNYHSSFILTKEGMVYGCGLATYNGLAHNSSKFAPNEFLNKKKNVYIGSGYGYTLIMNNELEIFLCGNDLSNYGTLAEENKIFYKIKHNLQLMPKGVIAGYYLKIFFKQYSSTLLEDFQNFFNTREFSDCEINTHKAHKLLLELRTQKSLQYLQNKLKYKYKEDVYKFLQWVYFEKQQKGMNEIFKYLEIENPKKKLLKNDLKIAFQNNDSKDFSIVVKSVENDDLIGKEKNLSQEENRDTNNDDVVGDENFEEIQVHKFILLARSGLFREMFTNVKKQINKVTDYSGRDISSLEFLIKYFYLDEIELTGDDDIDFLIEELEDAIDYYQLNPNSSLLLNLKQKKKKLKNN
ncbi:btk-binding protein-related [Anaeramoeba flamelloides]|uniref:Btk-binding protein-related n=1 Tax=Anaeramoeba flamelloides TaxID=1746091 RepID=A0ABQ8Y8F1_9EUKA|nr:btk-binding protein-related [Anaeramoeba flamelloides]